MLRFNVLDICTYTYQYSILVANTYIVYFLRALARKSGVDFITFNSQDCVLVYALLINILQKCLSVPPHPDANILTVLKHGVHPILKIMKKFLKTFFNSGLS